MDINRLKNTIASKPSPPPPTITITDQVQLTPKQRLLLQHPAIREIIAALDCEVLSSQQAVYNSAIQSRVSTWITEITQKPSRPRKITTSIEAPNKPLETRSVLPMTNYGYGIKIEPIPVSVNPEASGDVTERLYMLKGWKCLIGQSISSPF